jgi:glycine cleavage system H protein
MSELLAELKYARTHEWVRDLGNGIAEIGISDHAQESLGDLVYVELPEVGRQVDMGNECAVVESVKAASDIYSPVTGEILEVNETLNENPEVVNQSPYAEGWLFRIRMANPAEIAQLLDADAYKTSLD